MSEQKFQPDEKVSQTLSLDAWQPDGQIRRITHMEQLLREACAAVAALDKALADYQAAQDKITELQQYYEGGLWMADFQADCDGKLPDTLPRGVLTEDAIYDLLTDRLRLQEMFRELS